MAFVRVFVALACGVSVAGCEAVTGIGEGNTPDTELVTLNVHGEIPDQGFGDLTGGRRDMALVEGQRTGYAYEYGLLEGTTTFQAVAGVAPNSYVGPEISTGSVSYNATYQLTHLETDTLKDVSGDISIYASLTTRYVYGDDDNISISGSYTGNALDGSVYYDGLVGDMTGLIGTEGIVGAFAGNSSDEILVGGFVGTAN
ncbi:hypothetical protein [Loktanella sp. S4079]|uniref:hypothetical protein n=1 Tax=Loktanella sp. S4079 TaxID=579483 RepID=UPI0005FA2FD1|nr:hypothetical protein [Loktanella sp. S4079]KJZ19214.1 hypothetical protein TW80_10465 [Loktanella sp. S4079]